MKYLNQLASRITLITLIGVTGFAACKKDEIKNSPMASLRIVNGIAGGTAIRNGAYAGTISNISSRLDNIQTGGFDIYIWPNGDSLHPYYVLPKFVAQDREIYSLFLCGPPTAVEGIIVKEDIPYWTDTIAGIRFVNLSPNSTGINITRLSTPTVNDVTNLQYKSMTGFIGFPAGANVGETFQFRNASTNAVLASVAFTKASMPRWRNMSLVFRGMVGGTPAVGVTQVTHDR